MTFLSRIRSGLFVVLLAIAALSTRPVLAMDGCGSQGPCESCATAAGRCTSASQSCSQWDECEDVGLCLETGEWICNCAPCPVP